MRPQIVEECGVATSRVLNVGLGRGTRVTGGMSKAWPNLLSFHHHALLVHLLIQHPLVCPPVQKCPLSSEVLQGPQPDLLPAILWHLSHRQQPLSGPQLAPSQKDLSTKVGERNKGNAAERKEPGGEARRPESHAPLVGRSTFHALPLLREKPGLRIRVGCSSEALS